MNAAMQVSSTARRVFKHVAARPMASNADPPELRAAPARLSNETLAAIAFVLLLVVIVTITVTTRQSDIPVANNKERDRQRLAWCQGRCPETYPYDATCSHPSFKGLVYPRDKDKRCKHKSWKATAVDANE